MIFFINLLLDLHSHCQSFSENIFLVFKRIYSQNEILSWLLDVCAAHVTTIFMMAYNYVGVYATHTLNTN